MERRTEIYKWKRWVVFMTLVRDDPGGSWRVENPRKLDRLPEAFWEAWAND
jgi:hypothetical protein